MSTLDLFLAALSGELSEYSHALKTREKLDYALPGVVERVLSAVSDRQCAEAILQMRQSPREAYVESINRIAARIAKEVGDPELEQPTAAYLEQIPRSLSPWFRPTRCDEDWANLLVEEEYLDRFAGLLPRRAPWFRVGDRPECIQRWELTELLGTGGFGEVWLGTHPQFRGTQAAFKFCIARVEDASALRHEAKMLDRILSQQPHPGVVRLQNADLTCPIPWLQYEYVRGGNLRGLAEEWKGLPFEERALLVRRALVDLADTVGHFHAMSPPIVHRDLKPENILVDRQGNQWRLKVADFGISHVSVRDGEGLSSSTERMWERFRRGGTEYYAPPEQGLTPRPEPCQDIHALGAIGYHLVTGDFSLRSIDREGHRWIPPLLQQGWSRQFLSIIARCVEHDPAARPQNGRILADLLRHTSPVQLDSTEVAAPGSPAANVPPPDPAAHATTVTRAAPPLSLPLPPELKLVFATLCRGFDENAQRLPAERDRAVLHLVRALNHPAARAAELLGQIFALYQQVNRDLRYLHDASADQREAIRNLLLIAHEPRHNALAQVELAHHYYFANGLYRDFAKARAWLERAAAQGSPQADHFLGLLHQHGHGVGVDAARAADCHRKAAEAGYGRAMRALADCYAAGAGVGASPARAREWYRRAFEAFQQGVSAGNAGAIYDLAMMYVHGKHVAQNYPAALKLLDRSALLNHAESLYQLGCMTEAGQGVPGNHEDALEYYRAAAEEGLLAAQYRLGERYAGRIAWRRGAPACDNHARALHWLRKAAARGCGEAMVLLATGDTGDSHQTIANSLVDPREATRLLEEAAALGSREAKALLDLRRG